MPKKPIIYHMIFVAALFVAQTNIAGALEAGDKFRDCSKCPEMVIIPGGQFIMGTNKGENNESPAHNVVIDRPLAIGRFEVSFDEWEACVADGGCNGYLPDDLGEWGRGRRPVIFVDWNEAHDYTKWLSAKTKAVYRLLTEAEWEYAARAGTTSIYPWGQKIGTGNANCRECDSGWDGERTAPVGSFSPNPFGLHDMAGNVREWVEDCWHDGYAGAKGDGSAWTENTDCNKRVLRGGAWGYGPESVLSAYRNWDRLNERMDTIGFRVARELSPKDMNPKAD